MSTIQPLKKLNISCGEVRDIKRRLRVHKLHTVCEEARCPNLSECFSRGTAAFLILGGICTRSCGFCGVKSMKPETVKPKTWNLPPPDPSEPEAVAVMAKELGLRHVVITSVTRDDLPDEGAGHFAATINEIKNCILRQAPAEQLAGRQDDSLMVSLSNHDTIIEILTPDFHGRADCLKTVCDAGPAIFNHNVETVRRLTPIVRSHAEYERSLAVLKWVSANYPSITVKSGLMLGLGEKEEEVLETLNDLCNAGCSIVTIGQYLSPGRAKLPVVEYIKPEAFEKYKVLGEGLGIKYVFSGAFVRSSYMADRIVF